MKNTRVTLKWEKKKKLKTVLNNKYAIVTFDLGQCEIELSAFPAIYIQNPSINVRITHRNLPHLQFCAFPVACVDEYI